MDEVRMIRTLLQQPIAFHRVFVTLTGNVAAGLFLSQAWYWTIHNREDREGWFYKSQEEWIEETGLTRHEQDAARRRLRECGFLLEARRRMPARLWFRLDLSRICQALSSLPEFGKQDCRISANKIAEFRQSFLSDRDYYRDYKQQQPCRQGAGCCCCCCCCGEESGQGSAGESAFAGRDRAVHSGDEAAQGGGADRRVGAAPAADGRGGRGDRGLARAAAAGAGAGGAFADLHAVSGDGLAGDSGTWRAGVSGDLRGVMHGREPHAKTRRREKRRAPVRARAAGAARVAREWVRPGKLTGPAAEASAPAAPAGFEVRARDNRWHLYRLNGRKLSANGKPMWDRSYLGSFTEEELRGYWAESGASLPELQKNLPVANRTESGVL